MFTKGNKHGKGRPAYSLKSPEILLPTIFAKGNLNWAKDFIALYRKHRDCPSILTAEDRMVFKILSDLLPYLVTKINVKDLDLEKLMNRESAVAAKNQTAELVALLENERQTPGSSNQGGVGDGKPTL